MACYMHEKIDQIKAIRKKFLFAASIFLK